MTAPRRQSRSARGQREEVKPDLGRYVAGLENAVYKGIASLVTGHDLSPLDVYLLMICQETHECTATELARLLPVDASRVSRLVTNLADRGLVRRRRLRNDRRVVMLRLSPAGEQMTSEVAGNMEDYYAKLTDGISRRDLQIFSAAALKIIANYQAMQEQEG